MLHRIQVSFMLETLTILRDVQSSKALSGFMTSAGKLSSVLSKCSFHLCHISFVVCLLSVVIACDRKAVHARWLDQRYHPGRILGWSAKLCQANSGTYAIGLISWADNCHQTI